MEKKKTADLEVINYNNDFLILKGLPSPELAAAARGIYDEQYGFVDDVISSEAEVLVKVNASFQNSDIQKLRNLEVNLNHTLGSFVLPVCFDHGVDWDVVEKSLGKSKNDIIDMITKTPFEVAMLGFLPGFVYLNGLPKAFHVQRKAIPVSRVESGTIAIGGKYIGLYSLPSPGGWYSLGRTPFSNYNPQSEHPSYLNLLDEVTIENISSEEFDVISNSNISLLEYNTGDHG